MQKCLINLLVIVTMKTQWSTSPLTSPIKALNTGKNVEQRNFTYTDSVKCIKTAVGICLMVSY